MDVYRAIENALIALEAGLKASDLWQEHFPPAKALASALPFCHDTLDFEQWLQFVFIPQMRQLVERQLPLPGECAIAPMAEQVFTGQDAGYATIIASLARIDLLLTECALADKIP